MYTSRTEGASVFDVLRDEVPLDRMIEMNGHRKARCVAHEENTPSMHVYDDHVHCFGCGFHGDVVDIWGKQKGIDRPIEAALALAQDQGVRLPEMSEESRRKAEETRQKQADNKKKAQSFHETLSPTRNMPGARSNTIHRWWEQRGFGEEAIKRFLLGATAVTDTAVIPFWSRGQVAGLIRRKLEGEPKYILPKAEEFPGGLKPLFIPGPMSGELFLVEGYIDALAVAATGKSAAAIGGTNASEKQIAELRKISGRIYILPDRDEAGPPPP